MPIIKEKFFRLPETLSPNELREMIEIHDCHLSPMDSCECAGWREILKRKSAVRVTQSDREVLRKDYLHYN